MKKFYYFIGTLLFMSCSQQDIVDSPLVNETQTSTRAYGGDGEDDVLGYSCDISKALLVSKLPVIDNKKVNEKYSNPIIQNMGQSGGYFYNAGTTAFDYLKSISENKEIKIKASFFATATSTISSSFKETEAFSASYSYASFERIIQKREYTYSINTEQLKECLSENFVYDLNNNFSPQAIIAKYGTHVYGNIKVGGKITVLYRANITSTSSELEKKNTVSAGLSGSIGKIFGGSVDTSISKEEIEKASQKISNAQFVINSIGGNSNIPMMGIVINAETNNYSVNIQEWERSVSNGNTTVLIDFNPGTLIPIWELVSDENKKKALQTAIENYITEKSLSDRIMMYEYLNSNGNFFCTVHVNELESYGYSRIGTYGYVYSYKNESTVPLYTYKSPRNNDHTYSLERNDQHYSESGYYYLGIECYVPSNITNPATEIMPVYYYSRYISGKLNHYYSTTRTSYYQGAPYRGISFYVYKRDK